ncbi:MAG TPA: VWA domain-containing protein [Blastocatellia bacterium]|nr:VWA domain-containing protein [Blastocatellia bacterium]
MRIRLFIFARTRMPGFQRPIIFILAGALIAGVPAPGFAQDTSPQRGQDVVRITTQLVQVDAVVTDKKGKHVEDLTEGDFELLVDGKKQQLTHFSHVSLPTVKREPAARKEDNIIVAPESMPTRQIAPEDVRRAIAFVVDDMGLSPPSMALARETLRKFVGEQMQDGDLVAIIRTGSGLGMLEQFTSDKRILYTAIDKLVWNPLSRDMMPSFADTSGAGEMDETQAERQAEQQAAADSFQEFVDTSFTTGTLGATSFVVRNLRNFPGRKSVILLSDGFRINSKTDNDNSTNQVLQSLENLVEQANRSSVVIYSIDAKGLQPFMPGADAGGLPGASSRSDALQTAQEALEGPRFLSEQTGGFTVVNTNDLNIGIDEALYDLQSYYLLGFDPEDEKFDQRRHSIKVKVNRPDLRVRSRSGFFGVSDGNPGNASLASNARADAAPNSPGARWRQILSGLIAPMGARDLSLRMTPYFFNSSKDGPIVRALFHIDCSKLTFKEGPDGRKRLDLDLAAFALDEEGITADLAAHRLALNFDEKRYREALAEGLAYRADFQLKKPGAYQFRAVLRDGESGRTGSVSQFIRLPDLKKNGLALSGLVLTKPKTVAGASADNSGAGVVTAASPTGGDNSPAPGDLPRDLQATPYVRKFPRSGLVQYGVAIYNAVVDKKTGAPQITVQAEIYSDGKPVYRLPPRSLEFSPGVNPKRFDYVGRLQLKDFPIGDYLLHVIVTDGLAKKKFARAEQWMDFSVK